jgi:Leucine-rich repeat (LRR) protein
VRFLRYTVAAGALTAFAVLVWATVDLTKIEAEQQLNDAVVDAILGGQATPKVSSMHYQTALAERRVCGLSSHPVTVVSVFMASDRMQGDTYRQVLRLRGLTRLSLTEEIVDADTMTWLQRMPELRGLDCWQCRIDGGKLRLNGPLLRSLSLSNSHVSLDALDTLLAPGTIRELRLPACDLDLSAGGMDMIVSRLPQLEVLDLRRTNLSDESATRIAELRSLRDLSLGETAITDRTLQSVLALDSLASLQLSETNISDVGIRELARTPSLREIVVARCPRVTKESVAWLRAAKPNLTVWSSHPDP